MAENSAAHEGWVAFEVDKSDTNPLISFNRDKDGKDELDALLIL